MNESSRGLLVPRNHGAGTARLTCALSALAATVIVLALMPSTSQAGTLSLSGGTLTYNDLLGDTNQVVISPSGSNYRITDTAGITALSCTTVDANTADCSGVTSIFSNLLGGDDSISVSVSAPATLLGDTGNDVLSGGSGSDTLNGGDGSDTLNGGAGNDSLSGADGADTLDGGTGADTLNGGAGNDTVTYASRTSAVTASPNGQAINGEPGEGDNIAADVENITGGSGNDALIGNASANALAGGAGDDTLDGGTGADTLNGGPGNDTVTYASRTSAVYANINGVADDGEGCPVSCEGDNVAGDVEGLIGGSANDTLIGSSANDTISGGEGADTINGAGGADVLAGNSGEDTIDGLSGDDAIDGGSGFDTVRGGDGNDVFRMRDGAVDQVSCGLGIDSVTADWNDSLASDCELVDLGPSTPTPTGGRCPATLNVPSSVRLSRRVRIALKLSYADTRSAACTGTITLRGSGRVGRKKRTLTLGQGVFTVRPGTSVSVNIKLSAKAAKMVRKKRRFPATATITASDASGTTNVVKRRVTLRARSPRRS